jgi:hypothetical protein
VIAERIARFGDLTSYAPAIQKLAAAGGQALAGS